MDYATRVINSLLRLHAHKAGAYEFTRFPPEDALKALKTGVAWAFSNPERLTHNAPVADALIALTCGRVFPEQITAEARQKAEDLVAAYFHSLGA